MQRPQSEDAGTSFFTGAYPKQNRYYAGDKYPECQAGRQSDGKGGFRVETEREVG